MIRPWVFEFFHSLPVGEAATPDTVKRRFDGYIDMWTRDEALGYEGIIFSEHHFGPAYSPSPNLLVAAMASRTSTMRLGTLGVSTAYAPPLRIVEEAAMLDNLTDGRLEIGLVRGIPTELALLRMSVPEGDARFDQTLRAVDEAFKTAGGDFQCEGLAIQPPMRQTNPPKWLAIVSERSARRAASLGWKACTGFVSIQAATAFFDAYRNEAELERDAAADMLGLRRFITFVNDRADAAGERERLREFTIADLKAGPRTSKGPPPPASAIIDLDEMIRKALSQDECIVGTPADVAEEIVEQCRAMGCGHFMAVMHASHHVADIARDHRIFGEQVIPILRRADLTGGASRAS